MIIARGSAMAIFAIAFAAQPLLAKSPTPDELRIARCIYEASRGQPWLERTLWGLRDQEAGWLGAAVANKNGTHDLGPLQVNSWWAPRFAAMLDRNPADIRRWLRHDPCFNVQAARWIFLSALEQAGSYWEAVGLYHSPTAWRQRRYAALVAGKMRARFGADMFAATAIVETVPSMRSAPISLPQSLTVVKRNVTYYGFGLDGGRVGQRTR